MKSLYFSLVLLLTAILANAMETVCIYPENLCARKPDGLLTLSNSILAVRANYEYTSIFRVDTECLGQVPQCKLEKVTFSFVVRNAIGGSGGGGVLEFHLMKKNIGEYVLDQKIELSEITDVKGVPLFSYQLPEKIEDKKRYEVNLPVNPEILDALKKGIAITLKKQDRDNISQLNIYGCQRVQGSNAYYPQLIIAYSTPAEKLRFSQRLKAISGKYVTAKDGDLYYDGKKIALFGTNINTSFSNHEEVDAYINRLLSMNITAARLWMYRLRTFKDQYISSDNPEFSSSKKGDNSYWDCFDYFVARAQDEGIFFHSTILQVQQDMPKDSKDRELTGQTAPYISDFYKNLRINTMRNVLNRVNPYTGQRYAEMPVFATWEIHNENGTVPRLMSGKFRSWSQEHRKLLTDKWNTYLIKKYQDIAGIEKAWGKLGDNEDPLKGTVAAAPIYGEEGQYPEQRGYDFLDFIETMFMERNREFESVARSCAPDGVGINVAPIIHAGHTYVNMHGQYTDAEGGMSSCGIYQTPYTKNKNAPFYPYMPMVTTRPYFYNINFQARSNMPFMIYEASFHRPSRYRVEFIPVLGLLAAGLGWDGIYFYNFSAAGGGVSGNSPLTYSYSPLPIPTSTKFGQYTTGFRSAGDEVVMASLAVTAQAYRNGIAPNTEKTRVIFGRPAIINPRWRNYSTALQSTEQVFTELAGGGVMEYFMMPGMYRKLIHASVRSQLGVDFDPTQDIPIRVEGKQLVEVSSENDNDILESSPDITWNPRKAIAVLDNKHSKILVGVIPEKLQFNDKVSFKPNKSMFGFFGLSTRDGKAVAESEEIMFALTAESQNTGYELDLSKMTSGPLALIPAVVNTGKVPVIVTRPAGEICVPGKPFTLKRFNFAGYCYKSEEIKSGKFTVEEGEPLFLGVMTRK